MVESVDSKVHVEFVTGHLDNITNMHNMSQRGLPLILVTLM